MHIFRASFYRRIFISSALLILAQCQVVLATPTITPLNAATDDNVSGTRTVYFPVIGASCGTPRVYPSTLVPSNPLNDPTPTSGAPLFTIAAGKNLDVINGGSLPSSGSDLAVHVEVAGNSASQIALYDAGNGYNNVGNSYYVNYGTVAGAAVKFGLAIKAGTLCGFLSGGTCTPGKSAYPSAITLRVGVIKNNNTFTTDPSNSDYADINVMLVDCPAHTAGVFNLPTLNFTVLPGDQRIKVLSIGNPPTVDTVPLKSVVVYTTSANTQPTLGNSVDPSGSQTEIQGQLNGGTYTVSGLANETRYCVGLGFLNKGGYVTTDSSWSDNLSLTGINIGTQNCATPSQIDGFLNRSTCFIASAAYGEEWDPRLEILRQFRGQILETFGLGRVFVRWYYSWSPSAAHWLIANPGYKAIVRFALIPVVEGARISLWMRSNSWLFAVLFLVGTAATVTLSMRRRPST